MRSSLERACELLQKPGATVAPHLRFSDPANFTRAFRRQLGVTPSEYQASRAAGP